MQLPGWALLLSAGRCEQLLQLVPIHPILGAEKVNIQELSSPDSLSEVGEGEYPGAELT